MPALPIGLGETAETVSTAVPQPFDYQPEEFNVESVYTLASSGGGKDLFGTRQRWTLQFRGLSHAQRGLLRFYHSRPRTFFFRDMEGNLWEVMSVGSLPTPTTLGNHDEGGLATLVLEWVGSGTLDSSFAGLFTLDYSALDGGHVLASGSDVPLLLDETPLGLGALG